MVRAAISTFGGVETQSSYQAGLQFEQEAAGRTCKTHCIGMSMAVSREVRRVMQRSTSAYVTLQANLSPGLLPKRGSRILPTSASIMTSRCAHAGAGRFAAPRRRKRAIGI